MSSTPAERRAKTALWESVIDFMQPFIDGKVSHNCDLERQAKLHHAGSGASREHRHSAHGWCHDNPFPCACPCHWSLDDLATTVLNRSEEYELPDGVVGWLAAHAADCRANAAQLQAQADQRLALAERIEAQ